MNKEELMKKIAQLESINDQMLSELGYVDYLMKQVGFSNGLATVKASARELSHSENQDAE